MIAAAVPFAPTATPLAVALILVVVGVTIVVNVVPVPKTVSVVGVTVIDGLLAVALNLLLEVALTVGTVTEPVTFTAGIETLFENECVCVDEAASWILPKASQASPSVHTYSQSSAVTYQTSPTLFPVEGSSDTVAFVPLKTKAAERPNSSTL